MDQIARRYRRNGEDRFIKKAPEVAVPVNQAVVAMIKAIETKPRTMSMKNIDDPVFDQF